MKLFHTFRISLPNVSKAAVSADLKHLGSPCYLDYHPAFFTIPRYFQAQEFPDAAVCKFKWLDPFFSNWAGSMMLQKCSQAGDWIIKVIPMQEPKA